MQRIWFGLSFVHTKKIVSLVGSIPTVRFSLLILGRGGSSSDFSQVYDTLGAHTPLNSFD